MLKVNQLKFTCLLLALLTISIVFRFATYGTLNNNDTVIHSNESINTTINPNTAQWPSLSRLPGIGQAKAKAIVHYRDTTSASNPSSQPVFISIDDLTAIKGIGKKTVLNIKPFLNFDREK